MDARNVYLDETLCRRAVTSRDARFDGCFITAVLTTGIYCRPSCPARTPRNENMRFYPTAATAQGAGFRACKRCRPDATPGSPEWNIRSDTVARAMRLIADGVVDRDGVPALAATLGYSVRQVERLLHEELGAGPLALAQAQRAQTARTLIESTDLNMADVAFASGFSSVRTFNDIFVATYSVTPRQLRTKTRPSGTVGGAAPIGGGLLSIRLPYREPLEPSNLLGHLIATAVPGVEEYRHGAYRAAVRLPHGTGIIAIYPPRAQAFPVILRLDDIRDLTSAVSRCRRLLDLDADPIAISETLSQDIWLRPLIHATPGRRVPHTLDPEQFAVRAILGQQVSTGAARTHAQRIAEVFGEPITDPDGGLTRLFPRAVDLAVHSHDVEQVLRMPASRRRTLFAVARALSDGDLTLDAGADWNSARTTLQSIPGIGPWTIETIAMRALGDPNAFTANDLGVRKAAQFLGLPRTAAALKQVAGAWAPWRAYAVQYLWATGNHPINSLPASVPVQPLEPGPIPAAVPPSAPAHVFTPVSPQSRTSPPH